MQFDRIITKPVCGENVNYGILYGSEKIVFIKTGAGGDIRGYEDKYIEMAYRAHGKLGATVICASNPDAEHRSTDEKTIRQIVSESGFSAFTLSFVGTSDGAYQILTLAGKFPETVKVLGINPSFITVSGLKEKLAALPQAEKILVFGTEDEEYVCALPALQAMDPEPIVIEGADHRFTGMTREFISLIDLLEHNKEE